VVWPAAPGPAREQRLPTGQVGALASVANINPETEVKADKKHPDRGPMLIISGEKDHQVPYAISHATYKKQSKNKENVTEFQEVENRGHSLTIDNGWQDVAQASLDFVSRFASERQS
jgi:non-heme chloroperoxidase